MECEECGYACDSEEKLEKHLKVHAVGLQCISCAYTAPSRAKWRQHVYSPSHMAEHKCTASTDCGFVAETTKHLKDHLKMAHRLRKGGTRSLNCSKCDFVAENHLHMRKHVLAHKKDLIVDSSTKKYLCPICNWSAESERKYKNHLWRHSGDVSRQQESSFVLRCDHEDCKYKTSRKDKLAAHKLLHEPDAPKFNCEDCPKTFKNSDALRCHRRLHTKRAIFVCPIIEEGCKYTTSLPEYLRAHVRNKHPDQKLFKCSKCDFVARETAKMELHVRETHPADGLFKCEKCGYETDRRKCYERHIHAQHASSVVRKSRCVICKENFGSDVELETHMATHREKKVVRLHRCPKYECDFTSGKSRIFRDHVEAHMKDESVITSSVIDLKEEPNLTKCATKSLYRDCGPPTKTSGTNSSSSSSPSGSRQGKFDFQKNVAGFLKINRSRNNVQMTPVVIKDETGEYFPGYGVDGETGAVVRVLDEDVEANMEFDVDEPDVKPDLTAIKARQ